MPLTGEHAGGRGIKEEEKEVCDVSVWARRCVSSDRKGAGDRIMERNVGEDGAWPHARKKEEGGFGLTPEGGKGKVSASRQRDYG